MILFDESHEEFCTVSGRRKRKSYRRFAEIVGNVVPCVERNEFLPSLSKADAAVIAEPHAYFSRSEVSGIMEFVEGGGGLLLIGNHSDTTRYYAFSCNEVLNPVSTLYGMRFNEDEVVFASSNIIEDFGEHEAFTGISHIFYWRGCSITLTKNEIASPMAFARNARSSFYASHPVVMCVGKKRIFALGDSSVWSNPHLGFEGDNFLLAQQVCRWCAKV